MASLTCCICQAPIAPDETGGVFWNPADPRLMHDFDRKPREDYRTRVDLGRVRVTPLGLLADILATPGQSWETVRGLFEAMVRFETERAREGRG